MSLPPGSRRVAPNVYRDREGRLWIYGRPSTPTGRRPAIGPRLASDQTGGREGVARAILEYEDRAASQRVGRRTAATRPRFTVSEWAQQLFDTSDLRPNTRHAYDNQLSHWATHIGDLALDAVTADDIIRAWSQIDDELAASTRKGILDRGQHIFEAAKRRQLITDNPVLAADITIRRHQVKRSGRRLDVSDLAPVFRWLADNEPQWLAYGALIWGLGLRPGEPLVLTWDDVDADGVLRLTPRPGVKTERAAPIPRGLLAIMREHRDLYFTGRRELVPSPRGGTYTRPTIYRVFSAAFEAGGITWGRKLNPNGFGLHDLRASWIALADRAGVREAVRRAIVGHASASVHAAYNGPLIGEMREAVETVWSLQQPAVLGELRAPTRAPSVFTKPQ